MSERLKILLLAANALDSYFIREFIGAKFATESLAIETPLKLIDSIKHCGQFRPHALILDPKCHELSTKHAIESAVRGHARAVIVLDDRPREGLLLDILPFGSISYLTRQMTSDDLAEALRRAIINRERVFDTSLRDRVLPFQETWHLVPLPHGPSLTSLTSQEKTILRLLASGMSVAECAAQLGITLSTADNHKTRMMKKLDLHKATQLTHFAIREGLIPV